MSGHLLPQAPLPAEPVLERTDWQISSLGEAIAARYAARDLVGPARTTDVDQPVYASVSARVEITMGELLINGIRYAGPPVYASLRRAPDGWLVVVSDTAAAAPPVVTDTAPEKLKGGLGMRLVVAVADRAGWYTARDQKHVWALLGDEPPSHLMDVLRP